MKTRIITGVVLVGLLAVLIAFSGTLLFPIALAVLAAIAIGEVANCIGFLRVWYISIPIMVLGAAAVALPWFVDSEDYIRNLSFAALIVMLLLFAAAVFAKGKFNFSELSAFFVCSVYIVAAFASMVLLRLTPSGKYLYLLVFIGPWVCDTFAYFTGRFFGRHKLIPEVSPKKTVEGSIGGMIFCVASYLLFGFIVDRFFGLHANYLLLGLAGLGVSIVSQIGDLTASVIKRQHNVKDYGKIFPGHGGVMDRFDSVLPTAILLYVIYSLSGISLVSIIFE